LKIHDNSGIVATEKESRRPGEVLKFDKLMNRRGIYN